MRSAFNGTHIVAPDLDFELGEAVEVPGITSDGRDEDLLLGGGGLEAEEEGVFEVEESEGVFAYDGGGFGEDAVLEGVGGDDGLAGAGPGSGRFLGVETVSRDLLDGRHKITQLTVAGGLVSRCSWKAVSSGLDGRSFIFCWRDGKRFRQFRGLRRWGRRHFRGP